MATLTDLQRVWYLSQLGLTESDLSTSDLETLFYSDPDGFSSGGSEGLLYAERQSPFATTATAAGVLVPGLAGTFEGRDRFEEIKLFHTFKHSVANTLVVAYIRVNDVLLDGLTIIGGSPSTTFGETNTAVAEKYFKKGVQYHLTVGLYGVAAGTSTLDASIYTPNYLAVG